ncbi:MAG: hypothetical protein WC637_03775, partial [Victivallales bacterium]
LGPVSSGAVSSYVIRTKGNTAKRMMIFPYQRMKNLSQCAIFWRLNLTNIAIDNKGNAQKRQYSTETIRIFR